MMKRTRHTCLLLLLLMAGCGKNSPDCFQASGKRVREALQVPPFSNITVFENVSLVLRHGAQQEVVVETGENLRHEVTARVVEGTLELRDGNGCNLFRPYGQTVVFVTTPDLQGVRSSTGWPIRSEGVLPFTDLRLVSESFNNPETQTTDGSFDLDLDAGRVQVVVNGIAYLRLRGRADQLQVTIAAGDSRIEAEALLAGEVRVDHRGSNEILVNPRERISGVIRGYGDVRAFNRPGEIEVEETFRGRLIFVE